MTLTSFPPVYCLFGEGIDYVMHYVMVVWYGSILIRRTANISDYARALKYKQHEYSYEMNVSHPEAIQTWRWSKICIQTIIIPVLLLHKYAHRASLPVLPSSVRRGWSSAWRRCGGWPGLIWARLRYWPHSPTELNGHQRHSALQCAQALRAAGSSVIAVWSCAHTPVVHAFASTGAETALLAYWSTLTSTPPDESLMFFSFFSHQKLKESP